MARRGPLWPRNYPASIGGVLSVVHPREKATLLTCNLLLFAYTPSPRLVYTFETRLSTSEPLC